MNKRCSSPLLLAVAGVASMSAIMPANGGESISLQALAAKTHFHGIAVDATDPTRLYLATHHGFFVVTPEGSAARLSDDQNDYMGFTPHPAEPEVFYASGHPASGGNLGFIESRDGGRTWRQLSPGVGGPVDFHQMDVSGPDPAVIYGVFHGLQASADAGRSWTLRGEAPPELLDLAASASRVDTLYAATKRGLLVSEDGGLTWKPGHADRSPATMVQSAADGSVYAFVWGLGLLRSPDDSLRWQFLSNAFGDRYLLHLAIDPGNARSLYAITSKSEIITSRDSGRTWSALQ